MSFSSVKYYLIIVLCFLAPTSLKAQNENNVWSFGAGLLLDFNTNPPKLSQTSSMISESACASIADKNGNLIFYTNGETIWNSKDSIMANGANINGSQYSSQVLILKHPGPNSLYYLFHPNFRLNSQNGLYYSIVDISKNGGLGEVSAKNIQLSQISMPEKITAVRDEAGCGYWLITHPVYSDAFYTFHIDYDGIDTTPVISKTGIYYIINSAQGCLKVSPDGKKIASCAQRLELYDFNNSTGRISNGSIIDSSGTDFFDCSFSANSELLYATLNYSQLLQYNIALPSISLIISSKKNIYNNSSAFFGALQLAPNGKIYVTNSNDTVLSAIRFPNVVDTGCQFVYAEIRTGGYNSRFGLPNLIDNEHRINLLPSLGADTIICAIDSIDLKLSDTYGHFFLWNTGDTSSFIRTNKQGQYWIQTFYYCNYDTLVFSDTIKIITVTDTTMLKIGNDTVLCGDTFKIGTTQKDYVTYKWSNSDTTPNTVLKSSGVFWLETKSVCGTKYDTINIILSKDSVASFSLGNDTMVCDSSITLSSPFIVGHRFLWSSGDTTSSINVDKNDHYWLLVSSVCNTYQDSIRVDFLKDTTLYFLGNDTTVCGNSYTLSAPVDTLTKYLWSTGDTTNTIIIKSSGSYWINAINPCRIKSDSINIQLINDSSTFFDLGNDTIFCGSSLKILLQIASPNNKFLWSTGDTSAYINVAQPGEYWAKAYNICNSTIDTISVKLVSDSITLFDLGNDTLLCGGSLKLSASNSQNASYLWNTGDTTPSIIITKKGLYRITVTNSNCNNTYSDSILISYFTPFQPQLPNDTILCEDRQDSIVLFSKGTFSKYLWSNGDTLPFIIIRGEGFFTLTTTDTCRNTFTDDVMISTAICECDLFVPNAFTPDGDGLNDVFYVSEYCGLIKYRLWIFNRWGEVMFETNNPTATWDGTYKGQAVPEGVYGVLIDYTFDKLPSKPDYKGTLTIMR